MPSTPVVLFTAYGVEIVFMIEKYLSVSSNGPVLFSLMAVLTTLHKERTGRAAHPYVRSAWSEQTVKSAKYFLYANKVLRSATHGRVIHPYTTEKLFVEAGDIVSIQFSSVLGMYVTITNRICRQHTLLNRVP